MTEKQSLDGSLPDLLPGIALPAAVPAPASLPVPVLVDWLPLSVGISRPPLPGIPRLLPAVGKDPGPRPTAGTAVAPAPAGLGPSPVQAIPAPAAARAAVLSSPAALPPLAWPPPPASPPAAAATPETRSAPMQPAATMAPGPSAPIPSSAAVLPESTSARAEPVPAAPLPSAPVAPPIAQPEPAAPVREPATVLASLIVPVDAAGHPAGPAMGAARPRLAERIASSAPAAPTSAATGEWRPPVFADGPRPLPAVSERPVLVAPAEPQPEVLEPEVLEPEILQPEVAVALAAPWIPEATLQPVVPAPLVPAPSSQPVATSQLSPAIARPVTPPDPAPAAPSAVAPIAAPDTAKPETVRRGWLSRVLRAIFVTLRIVLISALVWLAVMLALIGLYRYVDPPGSMLMLTKRLGGQTLQHEWVTLDQVSNNLRRAVITSEDGKFCRHWGFDLGEIRAAIKAGDGARGASTITQQLAKNLFLWPGKSYVRKGLEVPLTVAIEAMWPKWRIFEVYLNVAEWGPGVFGAQAAAQYHYDKPASALTEREAALLASSLPNPIARDAADPEPGHARRASTLQARMRVAGTSGCVITGASRRSSSR